MAKFGMGVAEVFAHDGARPPSPPLDGHGCTWARRCDCACGFRHRLGLPAAGLSLFPRALRVLSGPIMSSFYRSSPMLLIARLLLFAGRRCRGCYDMRRWHDEWHRERAGGA